ncbi:hypothetical protein V1279_006478 [Bradyrhizobium sp. AZCC 1610]
MRLPCPALWAAAVMAYGPRRVSRELPLSLATALLLTVKRSGARALPRKFSPRLPLYREQARLLSLGKSDAHVLPGDSPRGCLNASTPVTQCRAWTSLHQFSPARKRVRAQYDSCGQTMNAASHLLAHVTRERKLLSDAVPNLDVCRSGAPELVAPVICRDLDTDLNCRYRRRNYWSPQWTSKTALTTTSVNCIIKVALRK